MDNNMDLQAYRLTMGTSRIHKLCMVNQISNQWNMLFWFRWKICIGLSCWSLLIRWPPTHWAAVLPTCQPDHDALLVKHVATRQSHDKAFRFKVLQTNYTFCAMKHATGPLGPIGVPFLSGRPGFSRPHPSCTHFTGMSPLCAVVLFLLLTTWFRERRVHHLVCWINLVHSDGPL